jgi:hypothetical protein
MSYISQHLAEGVRRVPAVMVRVETFLDPDLVRICQKCLHVRCMVQHLGPVGEKARAIGHPFSIRQIVVAADEDISIGMAPYPAVLAAVGTRVFLVEPDEMDILADHGLRPGAEEYFPIDGQMGVMLLPGRVLEPARGGRTRKYSSQAAAYLWAISRPCAPPPARRNAGLAMGASARELGARA